MRKRKPGFKMDVLILILISVLLGVFGQLSMKRGMTIVGQISLNEFFSARIFSIILNSYVFLGISLYVAATALWLVVLSNEELSFAYPLISLGYIFVAVFSKIFFGENLTVFRMLGIALIVVGTYFVASKL